VADRKKRDEPHKVLAGKYELAQVVGRGGMAVVWRASMLGAAGFSRPVAVKRMLFDISRDPQTVSLFIEEARVGSHLAHPNIVQVLDFGQDERGVYYLVLEWVDGLDFLDYMRSYHQDRRHVPWQAVAAVALQALAGLSAAHEHVGADGQRRPVIHRDVTPSNILVGTNGIVKLADFGLARAMDRMTTTLPNIIKGKMAYTAPELARGQKVSERSDLFAFGVTLWEALTGRRMFSGETPIDIIRSIQAWNVPSLATIRPDVPAGFVDIVESAAAKAADDRFVSAREMARALNAVLRPLPDPVDATRLGISVANARDRLKALDAEVEELAEPEIPSSVSIDVTFESSPASLKAERKATSETFAEDEAPTLPKQMVVPRVPSEKKVRPPSKPKQTRAYASTLASSKPLIPREPVKAKPEVPRPKKP
jgi:serine/threonine-protein kinase